QHPAALIGGAVIAIIAGWIAYKAFGNGFTGATTTGPQFVLVTLNGLTLAGLYFIVASGFNLIFGLMRIVNMAHGSLYLFGGYIAFDLQNNFVGSSGGFGLLSSQVAVWQWVLPAIIASACIAVIGLVMQQVSLRWTQGQDLRQ